MAVITAVDARTPVRRGTVGRHEWAELEAAVRRHPAGRRLPHGRPAMLVGGGPRHRRASAGRGGLRARLVLVGLATAALLILNWWLSSSAGAASLHPEEPRQESAASVVVVQPGDTLWAIALQVAPQEDPRATIQVIREANGMRSAGVQAGQRLIIPAVLR